MEKSFWIIGGIAVLFMLTSDAIASAKPANPTVAAKQEQRVGKVAKKKVAAKPAVQAAPRQLHKAAPRAQFKYIKVLEPLPLYANPWVLLMGGSFLFLLGGIFGRFLSFGPIPRKLEEHLSAEEKVVEPIAEGWLKKFFGKFRKTGISCQPAA